MKKLTLTALLFTVLSIAFVSCKKDAADSTTTSGYYIKGKKDGVAFNFTGMAQAQVLSTSGYNIISLIANNNTMEGFNIGLNLSPGVTLQSGTTYSEDYSGANYIVSGVYNPNSTAFVYSAGIYTPSAQPLAIKILTKTSTEITGTFSGAFYKQSVSGIPSSEHVTITEGEFKLLMK